MSVRPNDYWRAVGELGTLGLSFVLALAIGTGGGIWADRTFGTAPWGMLVGLAIGFAAAVLNVYRITSRVLAAAPTGTPPRPRR